LLAFIWPNLIAFAIDLTTIHGQRFPNHISSPALSNIK
jgi:hypothetical protein